MTETKSNVNVAITQYCALQRDMMLLNERSKEHQKKFKDNVKEFKSKLMDYLTEKNLTCVPFKVVNEKKEEVVMYLRRNPAKQIKRAVNRLAIQEILDKEVTDEDIHAILKNQKTSKLSVPDLIMEWILIKLQERNCSTTSSFQLSKSKEKVAKKSKKNEDEDEIKLPSDILETAKQLYNITHNLDKLKSFMKEKKVESKKKEEQFVPVLDEFLAKKEIGKQTQKVVMNVSGVASPFYLKRKEEVRSKPLPFTKAPEFLSSHTKSILKSSRMIDTVVRQRAPELFKNAQNVSEVVVDVKNPQHVRAILSKEVKDIVRDHLLEKFAEYVKTNQNKSVKISLDPESKAKSKRPRENVDDNTQSDDDDDENEDDE